MGDSAFKTRENRIRRMAERQGLQLHKHRARDPRHRFYRTYFVSRGPLDVEGYSNAVLTTKSLDAVEHFLTH